MPKLTSLQLDGNKKLTDVHAAFQLPNLVSLHCCRSRVQSIGEGVLENGERAPVTGVESDTEPETEPDSDHSTTISEMGTSVGCLFVRLHTHCTVS